MQNVRWKNFLSLIFHFALLSFICVLTYADSMVIQSLAFRGNSVFSKKELERFVESREGTQFEQKRFKRDLKAIVLNYRKKGYTFARTNPVPRFFSDGVYLMIEIDEGIIGKISVYGNEHTKKEVIVQELLLKKGSIYNKEDELESERILRRKKWLGKAEIIADINNGTEKVDIKVEVTDLWTLFPSISFPVLDDKGSDISIAVSDTNVLGYGQKLKLRYKHDTDSEDLISGTFVEPRLFDSHLLLNCSFARKMGETPWKVRLVRPFYSLKTNWSMELMVAEQIDALERLSPQDGKVEEKVARNQRIKFGRYTRSFGRRKSQIRLSTWGLARERMFELLPPEADAKYDASYWRSGKTNMVGLSFFRTKVDFIKETFLNKLGRIEDIQLGYNYGISVGYAPELIGSDEDEIKLMFHTVYSTKYGNRNLFDIECNLQTQHLSGHQSNTIADINARYFLKDLFTSQRYALLEQTLAVRLAGRLGDNLETRQLILDARRELRGYGDDRFVGQKIALLNIEDRMVFFKHPSTFCSRSPLETRLVIGGVIFVDIGYIDQPGHSASIKKSAGVGLRIGIPELSGSPVYRFDIAYAFDDPREFSFARAFSFGIGHLF